MNTLLLNVIVCKKPRSSRSKKKSGKRKLEDVPDAGSLLKEIIEDGDQLINDMLTEADYAEVEPDINWELAFLKVKEARMAMHAIEVGDFCDRFYDLSQDELLEVITRLNHVKVAALIDLPSILSGTGNNDPMPLMENTVKLKSDDFLKIKFEAF